MRSELDLIPNGLFDPDSCRSIMWSIAINIIIKGNRKCIIKNRLSVGFVTANPPQSHFTS